MNEKINNKNTFEFLKINCIGEVIQTSLFNLTISLWQKKNIEFGRILFIKEEQSILVGITYEIWQGANLSSRQPRALMLSEKEIETAYPHLEHELSINAKVFIFGELLNSKIIQNKSFAKIHSWAQLATFDIKEAHNLHFTFLEKIISEDLLISSRERLLIALTRQHLSEINSVITQEILDKYYLLATQAFNNDALKLANYFQLFER
jgi:hypothetical protein